MTSYRSFALSLLFSATVLSGTVVTGACEGGGGGDVALADLEEEFSAELCKSLVACGGFRDVATCLESGSIAFDQLLADVEAGLAEYDASKARECLDSIYTGDCSIFGGALGESDACEGTFVGSIATGGSCFDGVTCAGRAFCEGSDQDSCTPGICVAQPPDAAEGESCAEAQCTSGLVCGNAQICEVAVGPGEACEQLFDCADGYLCALGPDATPGTCVEVPGTGETCDPELGGEFLGGRYSCLQSTDFCDSGDNTCKAKLEVGADCTSFPFACVNYASCIEGTCQAAPGLGDSCVADSELTCLGSLSCEGGTCVQPPAPEVCSL